MALTESGIVAKHEHRDPVGDPITLWLDKTLVELFRHRRVIGLDHSLASEKFDMRVVGIENIGQKGSRPEIRLCSAARFWLK